MFVSVFVMEKPLVRIHYITLTNCNSYTPFLSFLYLPVYESKQMLFEFIIPFSVIVAFNILLSYLRWSHNLINSIRAPLRTNILTPILIQLYKIVKYMYCYLCSICIALCQKQNEFEPCSFIFIWCEECLFTSLCDHIHDTRVCRRVRDRCIPEEYP